MNNLNSSNICGSNFGYGKFSLEKCLDDNAELGLTKFELWGYAPHLHVEHTGAAEISRFKSNLAERGIEMVCYTPEQVTYPVNNAAEDEILRLATIKFFKRAAEIAADVDCPYLFVNGGWGEYDKPRKEAWDRAVLSQKEITEYAQTLGVCCITESLQPRESNLVLTANDVKQFLDDVGSTNLKACLDIVAMAVQDETPADHFKLYGEKIVHCHFQDGNPSGHMAWGDGNLPLVQYLRDLDELGYTGALMPELSFNRHALDPTAALQQAVSAMREALS